MAPTTSKSIFIENMTTKQIVRDRLRGPDDDVDPLERIRQVNRNRERIRHSQIASALDRLYAILPTHLNHRRSTGQQTPREQTQVYRLHKIIRYCCYLEIVIKYLIENQPRDT